MNDPGTGAAPRLAVSVVSHGHGALLLALLDDLAAAVGPADAIIVTFNIDEEGFDRARWPRVIWIDNPVPKGFGANHNAALLGRDADWYGVINPDIRLAANTLATLLASASADPEVAMVAPRIVDAGATEQDSGRALLTPGSLVTRVVLRLGGKRGLGIDQASRIDWLAGMFLIVRADAFAALGGFDERFFLYCEDMDLSLRLQLAGHTLLFDRSVTVVHDARRDSHRDRRHLRLHLASLARAWTTLAFWQY